LKVGALANNGWLLNGNIAETCSSESNDFADNAVTANEATKNNPYTQLLLTCDLMTFSK
jgi:hypothetical protein